MVIIVGANQPRTSNVRATSEMTPHLVDEHFMGRLRDVDIVSLVEFHSTPSALGWLYWLLLRSCTGTLSLREGSIDERVTEVLLLHFLKSKTPLTIGLLSLGVVSMPGQACLPL